MNDRQNNFVKVLKDGRVSKILAYNKDAETGQHYVRLMDGTRVADGEYEEVSRYEYPKDLIVKAKDLRLADIIRLNGESMTPYETMTVMACDGEEVVCFRPFTHSANYATATPSAENFAGNLAAPPRQAVSCYVGVEQITYFRRDQNLKFKVFQREHLD